MVLTVCLEFGGVWLRLWNYGIQQSRTESPSGLNDPLARSRSLVDPLVTACGGAVDLPKDPLTS